MGYIDDEQLAWARQTTSETAAALNAYIKTIRKQKQGADTYGDKYIREPALLGRVRPTIVIRQKSIGSGDPMRAVAVC